MARSVVVAATSDESALLRRQAAFVAMATAEYFRDQGKSVLLVMDSVTRLAMAQREIARLRELDNPPVGDVHARGNDQAVDEFRTGNSESLVGHQRDLGPRPFGGPVQQFLDLARAGVRVNPDPHRSVPHPVRS